MLPSYLLSLREGLEAALVIGIVLGALRKIRRMDLAPALWIGTGTAIAASTLVAVLLTSLGLELEDPGEAIFEAATMLIAAGILTWMIFWMSRQSRTLKSEIEEGVNRAASTTGRSALFWLAFISVVREGIELALFLTAAFFVGDRSDLTATSVQTLAGTLLGLGTAVLLGWTLFATTVRLDLHRFFQVTGALLILFAAGLIAHGIHEINDIGWVPALVEHVWDVNAIIPESSLAGDLLKTLFGYNAAPSLTEMLAYGAYFVAVFLRLRRARRGIEKATVQSQA
jgi:high-affinity iron transporter